MEYFRRDPALPAAHPSSRTLYNLPVDYGRVVLSPEEIETINVSDMAILSSGTAVVQHELGQNDN